MDPWEVVVSRVTAVRRAESAEAPASRRPNRAERKEMRVRAAAEAELEARIARARRRLAQAGGSEA